MTAQEVGPDESSTGVPHLAGAVAITPLGRARALLRATRPRQWAKNVLVLAAPLLGGVLERPEQLLRGFAAMGIFILASAGVYLVNDLLDVELDRAHPTKRNRPIASGALPIPLARACATLFVLGAPALAGLLTWRLAAVVTIYLVASLLYCARLKAEPVIELVIVASGFLLRAIAGGVATGIPLSDWFILTAGFGSLFVAAGKRYAELTRADQAAVARTRPVLAGYTQGYLRFVWTLSAAAVSLTYAQWALSHTDPTTRAWSIFSIVPFLVALLRYAVIVDRGQAGEPEEIILRDRHLLVLGAVWGLTLLAAVYR